MQQHECHAGAHGLIASRGLTFMKQEEYARRANSPHLCVGTTMSASPRPLFMPQSCNTGPHLVVAAHWALAPSISLSLGSGKFMVSGQASMYPPGNRMQDTSPTVAPSFMTQVVHLERYLEGAPRRHGLSCMPATASQRTVTAAVWSDTTTRLLSYHSQKSTVSTRAEEQPGRRPM